MTYESRVLEVLDSTKQMNQAQVIKAARMDATICVDALKGLMALGIVERTIYRNGRQGRPAFLYRRREAA